MNYIVGRRTSFSCAAVVLSWIVALPLFAGRSIPDPCKLITVAELEVIVGKISMGPKPADPSSGEVSCEYTVAKDSSWLMINLHEGNFDAMRKSFGGKSPVSVSELEKMRSSTRVMKNFPLNSLPKKGI